jgi:hypothetical protein
MAAEPRHILSPMAESLDFHGLHLIGDVSSADWIVENVRDFGKGVGSLVPVTFDGYARILHPASSDAAGGGTVDVAWSQVAAANGRIAHAAMEWVAITGDWKFERNAGQPGVWDHAPSIGSLPPRLAESLADVLAGFTTTPSECWFGVWEGYGNAPFRLETLPLIAMPQRKMALLRGPLRAAGTAFSGSGWPESASLWWPDDRTWCVATDIDLMSTYVGGSTRCITALLADGRLEAFRVSPDQTVHWESDTINPTPPPTSRGPRPTPPGDTPGR